MTLAIHAWKQTNERPKTVIKAAAETQIRVDVRGCFKRQWQQQQQLNYGPIKFYRDQF